ncbi:MAG: hypothetical protein KAS23_06075 [Anaerohalosphaera sp.]|nr:hypothetical protein [Anaerohalosphaera sp.]
MHGILPANWPREKVVEFIGTIDDLIDAGNIIKSDKTSTVSKVRFNDTDIVIKRYNNKGFFYSLRNSLRSSRAKKSWHKSLVLLSLDIHTPVPLGYVVEKKNALYNRSYFIMEYCEIEIVHDFFVRYTSADEQWYEIINLLKDFMAKLALHRITHGDLKPSNVYVTEDGVGILDLDSMMIHNNAITYLLKRGKDEKKFVSRILPKGYDSTKS